MRKIRIIMPLLATVTMLIFCSCNNKTDEAKKVGIADKYSNVQVYDQYATGINGESLKVQSAVVNDTLIAIMVEKSDTKIDDVSQAIIFAKNPDEIQEQTPEGELVLKCDENKTWMFYATLGSPTEEQSETQSTGYHPTKFIVVSDYIDYNGTIYKHK
ncbi:MAG: hypothetical protein IKO34_04575 [Bacteroidales bacterium]|nr:hypothetical protein [Bacteroidales bacterium]